MPLQNHKQNNFVYKPNQIKKAIQALKTGKKEVVIIDTNIDLPCPGKELVSYWNTRVKPEYRVPIPNDWNDITYNDYKGLPGISNGMWHCYASTIHDKALDSEVIHSIFTETTGTPNYKIRPNRFRFNPVDKDDGYKTAHIEGPNVLSDSSGISAILCISAGRTFTYYKGSNNDPKARDIFTKMGGKTSLFVMPSQEQLSHWTRTTVTTTKPGQVILFADSVAHEISRLGKNTLSIFLSPYDPTKVKCEREYYEGLNRNEILQKKKILEKTPPMPTNLMSDGEKRQHPKEYDSLTRRETEILGSLFHSTGAYWPSDKATFYMMHMMAFNAFKKKLLPFCFDSNGKFNYEFITPELVENCEEFDYSYFENLPFANITEEEIIEMKTKYNGIPNIAWNLIRYWTKDIRQCSENVCKRRDYIV